MSKRFPPANVPNIPASPADKTPTPFVTRQTSAKADHVNAFRNEFEERRRRAREVTELNSARLGAHKDLIALAGRVSQNWKSAPEEFEIGAEEIKQRYLATFTRSPARNRFEEEFGELHIPNRAAVRSRAVGAEVAAQRATLVDSIDFYAGLMRNAQNAMEQGQAQGLFRRLVQDARNGHLISDQHADALAHEFEARAAATKKDDAAAAGFNAKSEASQPGTDLSPSSSGVETQPSAETPAQPTGQLGEGGWAPTGHYVSEGRPPVAEKGWEQVANYPLGGSPAVGKTNVWSTRATQIRITGFSYQGNASQGTAGVGMFAAGEILVYVETFLDAEDLKNNVVASRQVVGYSLAGGERIVKLPKSDGMQIVRVRYERTDSTPKNYELHIWQRFD